MNHNIDMYEATFQESERMQRIGAYTYWQAEDPYARYRQRIGTYGQKNGAKDRYKRIKEHKNQRIDKAKIDTNQLKNTRIKVLVQKRK